MDRPLDRIAPLCWIARASAIAMALAVAGASSAAAQEAHLHEDGSLHMHDGLHFTHPLVAESVTPDRKIRYDQQFFEFPDGDEELSAVIEAEWAFHRSFSIEVGLPYSYSASEPGNLEVILKFANYAFEDAGLLLGYGLEMGMPTNGSPEGQAGEEVAAHGAPPAGTPAPASGPPAPRFSTGGGGVESTLGTDEWELAPFLNLGWKDGPFELVAWGFFGIPFGAPAEDEGLEAEASRLRRGSSSTASNEEGHGEGVDISYSLSALYAFSNRLQGVLELDGAGGITGGAVGEDVLALSPGVRLRIFPDRPLVLGLSGGFPLTDEAFFDTRIKGSLFWHF